MNDQEYMNRREQILNYGALLDDEERKWMFDQLDAEYDKEKLYDAQQFGIDEY